jgi:hypothetical protein
MSQNTIKEVTTKNDWQQFIKLPWKIYENDPLWVPPLLFDLKKQLNQKINPFFHDAEVKYWIAVDEHNTCTGRIAGILNHQHNKYYNEKTGFFGYFECINDQATSFALFSVVNKWLQQKGMNAIRGPVNLSLANECGVLIEGYHRSPILQMNYNPPYYAELIRSFGYKKEHDLLAFYVADDISKNEKIMQRLERLSNTVSQKEHISFRYFNTKDFKNEVEKIRLLFNDYMSDNWGFLPMEENEIDFIAQSLKPVLVKELAIFAEVNGETVGFSLSLPDINQLFKKMNGKLFPFGIFKFLFLKNKITDIRVMLMGINKPFRRKGLEAVFYYRTIVEAIKRKITGAELSWVSEDNHILIHELESLDAKLYKRYRIFRNEMVQPAPV